MISLLFALCAVFSSRCWYYNLFIVHSMGRVQFKVMVVGGPNQRTDYHEQPGEVSALLMMHSVHAGCFM